MSKTYTVGPGGYDTSKADGLTKTKSPAAVKMSKQSERANKFIADNNTAPGQYDVRGQSFGQNAKSFTIG